MKDIGTVLKLSTELLQNKGISRPRYSAEVLLSHVLSCKRLDLYVSFDRPLEEGELVPFREALKKRAKGEPLEYICGFLEFSDVTLEITPAVLIPRPETEILLEKVCAQWRGREGKALDLCTGSGCLAIGLKKKCPALSVTAVDLSESALRVAERNGAKAGCTVFWKQGDLTEPVLGESFDLILSNPPYISEAEYAELDLSVRGFEPKMALLGGATGLEFYQRLSEELPRVCSPNAQIFFEIGHLQGEGLLRLFSAPCWQRQAVEKDWSGHDRFFSAIFLENE